MAHSNQMREFQLTDNGIKLMDVYVGPGEVLTGSARLVQEARDQAQAVVDQQAAERRQRELEQEQAESASPGRGHRQALEGIGAELQIARERDTERRADDGQGTSRDSPRRGRPIKQ